MILLFLFLQILPDHEEIVYQTNDKGKLGEIHITSDRDSLGYHILYLSDRRIEVILDTLNLGTLYIKKFVKNKLELEIKRDGVFRVFFKGRRHKYKKSGPIYDRHTLDFALRGFKYRPGFKKTIQLHIPEFMIINADLEVLGEEFVTTPAGRFLCWKLQFKPRIFLIRMKFYFWIEKASPHRFIKYSDSSGKNSILLKSWKGEWKSDD